MEELGLGPNGGLIYCMEYPSQYTIPFNFIVGVNLCFSGVLNYIVSFARVKL